MANKTLYIDMDGTLTEFRHQDKICINDWNDTTIFENPEICTSTILGIKLKMDFQEEHFTNIDFIYIITQVPYTNYKIHIKHKQDTYNILYDLFKKKGIKLDGIIFVNTANYKDKVDYLIDNDSDLTSTILIDDTHSLLTKFEKTGGIAYHVSSFL